MNEIEFMAWVNGMDEVLPHQAGGVLYWTNVTLTDREVAMAEAEMERRRGARWIIIRGAKIDLDIQTLGLPHREES